MKIIYYPSDDIYVIRDNNGNGISVTLPELKKLYADIGNTLDQTVE
jgi:hypothetical protein